MPSAASCTRKASSPTSSIAISTTPISAPNTAASAPSIGRWATRKATSCPRRRSFEKIQETLDLGGTGILMQGGLHPDLKIEWYEDLLRSIKQRFDIHLHCFSAPEITNIAEVSGLIAARHHRPPARRGPRLHPRRRSGNSGRWRPPSHQPFEVHHQRMDRRAPHRTRAGHAHDRHHDVRLRRNHRAAHESLRYRAPHPGRHRRLHRLHPLDFPAREHVAWAASSRKKPPPSNTCKRWPSRASIWKTSRTSSRPG